MVAALESGVDQKTNFCVLDLVDNAASKGRLLVLGVVQVVTVVKGPV